MQHSRSGHICSVKGCGSRIGPIVSFPTPRKNLQRFRMWVTAVGQPRFKNLTDLQIYGRGYVCYKHFKPECFLPHGRLASDAVPTLCLYDGQDKDEEELLLLSLRTPPHFGQTSDYSIDLIEEQQSLQVTDEFELLQNLKSYDVKFVDIPKSTLPNRPMFPDRYKLTPERQEESNNKVHSFATERALDRQNYSQIDELIEVFVINDENSSTNISTRCTQSIDNVEYTEEILLKNSMDICNILNQNADETPSGVMNLDACFEEISPTIPEKVKEPEANGFKRISPHFENQVCTEDINNPSTDMSNKHETSELLKKPLFKSVKSFLLDSNRLAEVCRICFHSLNDEEVIKLHEEMKEQGQQIKTMLQLVLPDLDLELYPDIVICTNCAELVEYSFRLKEMWLTTEKKLEKIIEKKKGVTNRDADLVIVEKATKKRTPKRTEEVLNGVDDIELPSSCNQKDNGNCEMTDSVLRTILSSNNQNSSKVTMFYEEANSKNVEQKKMIIKKSASKQKGGPYVCEKCGKILKGRSSLRIHLKNHAMVALKGKKKRKIVRKFMCEICGQLFVLQKHLLLHERVHGEHKCSICNKEFNHYSLLKKHVDCAHSRQYHEQCHLCGKKIRYYSSLKAHLLSHNPKRTLPCNICGKKFRYPCLLRKHIRRHVNEKFSCPYCGKCVKYEQTLEKHIRVFHMNLGDYVCDFCNKPYWKKIDLEKHKIRIHGWTSRTEEGKNEADNSPNVVFQETIIQIQTASQTESVI